MLPSVLANLHCSPFKVVLEEKPVPFPALARYHTHPAHRIRRACARRISCSADSSPATRWKTSLCFLFQLLKGNGSLTCLGRLEMKSSLGNAWHIVGLITQALLNRFLVAQRVLVAQMLKNLPAMQEMRAWSQGGKTPWRREWLSPLVFLPGDFPGQRNLRNHGVAKSWTLTLSFHFQRADFEWGALRGGVWDWLGVEQG